MNSAKNTRSAWVVLAIVVGLEALGSIVLLGYTVLGFANRGDDEFLPALSILVVAAIAAFWVSVTFFALTRQRGWARGSALTIQIFIFSVAVGAFQGFYAQPAVGWALLVPAVLGFVFALAARPAEPTESVADPEASSTE